jgi:hypothetical protein
VQDAYFDFARNNRRFILELELLYKPLTLAEYYVSCNIRKFAALPGIALALLGAALAVIFAAYTAMGWLQSEFPARIAWLLALGAAMAVLPAVLIFPSYSTMADQALMLNSAVLGWIGAAIASVVGRNARTAHLDKKAPE